MQQYYDQDQVNWQRVVETDKFSLRTFNQLVHNHEISDLLAANTLLGLSKFYIPEKILKKVNIKALWSNFPKIIFRETENEDDAETPILFGSSRLIPTFFFNNYYYQEKDLKYYLFYDYIKVISCMKYKTRKKGNLLFNKHYLNP